MPSKALISVAKDYHRRKVFEKEGILGADNLSVDVPSVLRHVRSLRDHFTSEMIKATKRLDGGHLIEGRAEITGQNTVRVDDKTITAAKIIIATGSYPRIPGEWRRFGERILTSDNIFEQDKLPGRIAVIGLGPIGLELGQSLSRLGIEITGFDIKNSIAAVTDPDVNEECVETFRKEFSMFRGSAVDIEEKNGSVLVKTAEKEYCADAVLLAMGAVANLQGLGLENLGLGPDKAGEYPIDKQTTQIADLPVFIAGDANGYLPILHEALDEGFIAGRNGTLQKIDCYCRRTAMLIVFSDPQIAKVGLSYEQLGNKESEFVVGEADFSRQSRAMLEMRNEGLLHVFVDKESGQILGAEFVCPDAEHLAHLLAAAIQNSSNIFDVLETPFYHPTVEEALRTALRNAAKQLPEKIVLPELSLCDSCPEAAIT
jgi:dihydrolipoamide dehydrogenase